MQQGIGFTQTNRETLANSIQPGNYYENSIFVANNAVKGQFNNMPYCYVNQHEKNRRILYILIETHLFLPNVWMYGHTCSCNEAALLEMHSWPVLKDLSCTSQIDV